MSSAVGVKTLEVAHHCPLEGHTLESHDLDRHGAGGNVQTQALTGGAEG